MATTGGCRIEYVVEPRVTPTRRSRVSLTIRRRRRRREKSSDEIPVPCVSSYTGTWIFQRLKLESFRRNSNNAPVLEQELSIGRNEMRHRVAFPAMSMEPEAPIHRVDHSFPTALEFTKARDSLLSNTRTHNSNCWRTPTDRRAGPRWLLARMQERIRRRWRTESAMPGGE